MSRLKSEWPWTVLIGLLVICLAHGLWEVRGLGLRSAILDTYRDSGFVQGFLDGNLFGDPAMAGAWRYYPPFMHAVAAALASFTHTDPLRLLIGGAPWLNLLIPLCFFMAVRRLIDAPSAAIATTLLVCFDGLFLPPWMAATYSPWSSVPGFTQALFFATVWLIAARMPRATFLDAVAIGCMIGIVFLSHTVPALILVAILAAAVLASQPLDVRSLLWLATCGAVVALWALPFMLPLVTDYHLRILNPSGSFTDPLFDPSRLPRRLIEACLPGLAALLSWPLVSARGPAALPRLTRAILSVWLVIPALFMIRHYGCGGGSRSPICTALVVPVHHWMIYAQSALACIFGYVTATLLGLGENRARSRLATAALAGGALALLAALLIWRPMDRELRERAIDMGNRVDVDLYEWMLRNTSPRALFVTDISTNAVRDSAAMAVLAAGRRTVALPFTYSSPYLEWRPREMRDMKYLQAATVPEGDAVALCRLNAEAGSDNTAYIAVAAGGSARPGLLQLVFRSRLNDVYRVVPSRCT